MIHCFLQPGPSQTSPPPRLRGVSSPAIQSWSRPLPWSPWSLIREAKCNISPPKLAFFSLPPPLCCCCCWLLPSRSQALTWYVEKPLLALSQHLTTVARGYSNMENNTEQCKEQKCKPEGCVGLWFLSPTPLKSQPGHLSSVYKESWKTSLLYIRKFTWLRNSLWT